jgi:hypothetical protein
MSLSILLYRTTATWVHDQGNLACAYKEKCMKNTHACYTMSHLNPALCCHRMFTERRGVHIQVVACPLLEDKQWVACYARLAYSGPRSLTVYNSSENSCIFCNSATLDAWLEQTMLRVLAWLTDCCVGFEIDRPLGLLPSMVGMHATRLHPATR